MIDNQVLLDMSYGLYIVSTTFEGKNYGLIVDSVMQQNMNPPIVTVSIHHESYTSHMIQKTKKFAISILDQNTRPDVIETFGFYSSLDHNKFEKIEYQVREENLPIISENTCSYIICEVLKTEELEDHTLFFAKMTNAQKLNEMKPMTYQHYYESLKK